MLNPAGTGQSAALYDLLKSADNSPRSVSCASSHLGQMDPLLEGGVVVKLHVCSVVA